MKSIHKIAILVLWLVLVVMLVVTSLLPNVHPPTPYQHMDKVYHFSAYAFASFLPAVVIRTHRGLLWVCLFLVLIGIGTEYGQHFIPSRTGTVGDLIANMLGVLSGVIVGQWLGRKIGL